MKSTKRSKKLQPSDVEVMKLNLASALSDVLSYLPGLRWAMHRHYIELFECQLPEYFTEWDAWKLGTTKDLHVLTRNIFVKDVKRWKILQQDDEGWELLTIVDMALALVKLTDGIDPQINWGRGHGSLGDKLVRRLRISRTEFAERLHGCPRSTVAIEEYTAIDVQPQGETLGLEVNSAPATEQENPQQSFSWELIPYVKTERK